MYREIEAWNGTSPKPMAATFIIEYGASPATDIAYLQFKATARDGKYIRAIKVLQALTTSDIQYAISISGLRPYYFYDSDNDISDANYHYCWVNNLTEVFIWLKITGPTGTLKNYKIIDESNPIFSFIVTNDKDDASRFGCYSLENDYNDIALQEYVDIDSYGCIGGYSTADNASVVYRLTGEEKWITTIHTPFSMTYAWLFNRYVNSRPVTYALASDGGDYDLYTVATDGNLTEIATSVVSDPVSFIKYIEEADVLVIVKESGSGYSIDLFDCNATALIAADALAVSELPRLTYYRNKLRVSLTNGRTGASECSDLSVGEFVAVASVLDPVVYIVSDGSRLVYVGENGKIYTINSLGSSTLLYDEDCNPTAMCGGKGYAFVFSANYIYTIYGSSVFRTDYDSIFKYDIDAYTSTVSSAFITPRSRVLSYHVYDSVYGMFINTPIQSILGNPTTIKVV